MRWWIIHGFEYRDSTMSFHQDANQADKDYYYRINAPLSHYNHYEYYSSRINLYSIMEHKHYWISFGKLLLLVDRVAADVILQQLVRRESLC